MTEPIRVADHAAATQDYLRPSEDPRAVADRERAEEQLRREERRLFRRGLVSDVFLVAGAVTVCGSLYIGVAAWVGIAAAGGFSLVIGWKIAA